MFHLKTPFNKCMFLSQLDFYRIRGLVGTWDTNWNQESTPMKVIGRQQDWSEGEVELHGRSAKPLSTQRGTLEQCSLSSGTSSAHWDKLVGPLGLYTPAHYIPCPEGQTQGHCIEAYPEDADPGHSAIHTPCSWATSPSLKGVGGPKELYQSGFHIINHIHTHTCTQELYLSGYISLLLVLFLWRIYMYRYSCIYRYKE